MSQWRRHFGDNATKQTDPKVSQIHIYTRAHTTGHGHHTGGLQSIPTRGPVAERGLKTGRPGKLPEGQDEADEAASWGEGEATRTGRGHRRCTQTRGGNAVRCRGERRRSLPALPRMVQLGRRPSGCREGTMALVHSSPGDTGFGGFDGILGVLLSCVQYGLGSGKREVASVHLGAASQQEGAAANG